MPEKVNPDELRGYREGQIDAQLAEHSRHFHDINGSIATAAANIKALEEQTKLIGVQVAGVLAVMPKFETVAEKAAAAEVVAAALAKKTAEERSFLDRWKGHITFGLMVVVTLITIGNFTTRLLGSPIKTPVDVPAVTVTVPGR